MGFWSWRRLPPPHSREEGMRACPLGFWLLLLSPRRGWFPFFPPPPEGPVPATPFYIIPPASSTPMAPSPCPACPKAGSLRLYPPSVPKVLFALLPTNLTPLSDATLSLGLPRLLAVQWPAGLRPPCRRPRWTQLHPHSLSSQRVCASPEGQLALHFPPPLHTAWHPENNREAIVVTLRPRSKWFLPGSLPWLTSPNSTITCWY